MEWISAACSVVLDFYTWAIVLRTVMEWVKPDRRSPAYDSIERGLHRVTEPVLRPIRRALGVWGGFDLSPAVALTAIYLIRKVLSVVLPR
ncbi:MAG: YggT family protein [Bacillota bacterium]